MTCPTWERRNLFREHRLYGSVEQLGPGHVTKCAAEDERHQQSLHQTQHDMALSQYNAGCRAYIAACYQTSDYLS